MVDWYHDIIRCAAKIIYMVEFPWLYKQTECIKTPTNMITHERAMGNEYYKFSNKMSPEHTMKLTSQICWPDKWIILRGHS